MQKYVIQCRNEETVGMGNISRILGCEQTERQTAAADWIPLDLIGMHCVHDDAPPDAPKWIWDPLGASREASP